jgi:hypothetical protein
MSKIQRFLAQRRILLGQQPINPPTDTLLKGQIDINQERFLEERTAKGDLAKRNLFPR